MTDIRELLREAADDVAPSVGDPVAQVRRDVARRRRGWVAAASIVGAVATAIVVPLALVDQHTSRLPARVGNGGHAVVEGWEPDDGSVAAGFGKLWALKCCGGTTRPAWVDELNPVIGKRIARIAVPGPTTTIAVGAGRVWTIGATDGGPSAISAIDPATSRVTTLHLRNVHAEPYDIVVSHGSAWVTFDVTNQVWRLTPTPTGVDKTVLDVSGAPQTIATTGGGAIWVQRTSAGRGSLTRIVATRHSAHLATTVPWPGAIYSPAGRTSLWASSEDLRDIIELTPASLAGCSACAQASNITVKGPQIYAAIATSRGLFVSTFGGPQSPGHTNFYSTRDIATSRQAPTARIAGGGSLAPDGNGVVIGTDAGLIHWVPAG